MSLSVHVITRDGRPGLYLTSWLRMNKIPFIVHINRYSVATNRNASVESFLSEEENPTHLLQLDEDLVPTERTLPILNTTIGGDVAYCAVPPARAVRQLGLSPSCLRLSREFLISMKRPWFKFPREEGLLLSHAKGLGIRPVCLGFAGHLTSIILDWDEEGKQVRFRFPES